jgi:hypothetical protein
VIEVPKDKGESLPLAIEVAENSIRRQYTQEEVKKLIKRLEGAGYTHRSGRPRKSEKTIIVAMEAILGKSHSQTRRIVNGPKGKKKSDRERVVESLVRAAIRLRKESKDNDKTKETWRDAEARHILEAVEIILAKTETGKRLFQKRVTKKS